MCKLEMLFEGNNLASFNCEGYKSDEILKILNLVMGAEVKAPKLQEKISNENLDIFDMKELGKSIRLPKTTVNFRCPNCGQGSMLYINNGNELLCKIIDNKTSSLFSINEDVKLPSMLNAEGHKDSEKILNVYMDLIPFIGEKRILVASTQSCLCPVCGHNGTTNDFILAYENPLNIFDTSDLCEVCGDPGTIVLTENGDSILCENKCYSKLSQQEAASYI